MAIGTPSVLANGSSTTGGASSYSTASVSPASDTVVTFALHLHFASGNTTPTVAGNGLTWSLVPGSAVFTGDSTYLYVWVGVGTPSAGTITVTRAGADTFTSGSWLVWEQTGANTTTPVVQGKSATNGGSSVNNPITYDAGFQSGSCGLAMFGQSNGNLTATAKTGWTESAESPNANGRLEAQYILAGDTGADLTWSSAANSAGIAWELAAASAGGAPVGPLTGSKLVGGILTGRRLSR